ncbi:MAG: thioredoxin domain-containing protein, partial [Thermoanaerobaculia bacterium]
MRKVGLALAALAMLGAAAGERPANRLAGESSPYLQLHAHNPVDWYPWGPEAIERAQREDKPIFLSVGYSTCYWCHVMEREAFSDPGVAGLMNRWFVNIKVDREERPELDEIYMTATRLLTGRGGWPNSVFLTPELEPFFAGTYFPIDDRGDRPGFRTVLEALHNAWENRRLDVEERASKVAQAVRGAIGVERQPAAEPPARELAEGAVIAVKGSYDERWGGFGSGPKFPTPGSLMLLQEAGERGDAEAAAMVVASLERMGRGAIYDQLDGGFHRYTLDRAWRVPHFEKMLYDNAHLAELLAESWQTTRSPELERLARGALDFVLAEMTLPEGPFKSAIDAETDGEEGAFYVWSGEELRTVLDEEQFALLAPILGFDGEPNFEGGRHTLFLPHSLEVQAERLGLDRAGLLDRLAAPLDRLREARRERPFPRVDDKVLSDWNGMMIGAMARAGQLLDEPRYVAAAVRAARFVLARLRDGEGRLLHTWRAGVARIPAFLDDYAFLIRGLLALADATGGTAWRSHAERLAAEAEQRLGDPAGGYFLTADASDLLVRPKTVSDGAVPSGNAVMLRNLFELAARTGDDSYRSRAESGLRAFAGALECYPEASPVLALALLEARDGSPGGRSGPARVRGGDMVAAAAHLRGDAGADGWWRFEVRLKIADGWHVNANPASMEFLVPTRLGGPVRHVAYPAGERQRFAFADEELAVYSGAVAI